MVRDAFPLPRLDKALQALQLFHIILFGTMVPPISNRDSDIKKTILELHLWTSMSLIIYHSVFQMQDPSSFT